MAEFEELKLTVSLVDHASAGLRNLRAELGELTKSTDALGTNFGQAATGITNLGTAATNATPHIKTLNQHVRDAANAANELKDGFMRMGAAVRGLSSLPQLVGGIRDMSVAVHSLGDTYSVIGNTASVAVTGIGAIGIGIVALGAAVIAYGVSVFKFAGSMNELAKTARLMGMNFGELKYAQDQARRFGQSAESVTRSYQGIQAAQFDLYKNNSQLRAKLLAQGVDAGWIAQLQTLNPNDTRNAIIRMGKILEKQALASGAMPGVAASLRNSFGRDLGLSAEDMAGPELPGPSPEIAEKWEEIGRVSEKIAQVWRDMTHEWTLFSKEILAAGLPKLLEGMQRLKGRLPEILAELRIWITNTVAYLPKLIGSIPAIIRRVSLELKGVIGLFSAAFSVLRFIKRSREDPMEALKELFGNKDAWNPHFRNPFNDNDPYWKEQRDKGNFTIWDRQFWDRYNTLRGRGRMSLRGGANDNVQEELRDELRDSTGVMDRLAIQLEKINEIFGRVGGAVGGSLMGSAQASAYGGTGSPAGGGTRAGGGGSAGSDPGDVGVGPGRYAPTDASGRERYPRMAEMKAAMIDQFIHEGASKEEAEIGANVMIGQAIAESGLKSQFHDAGKRLGYAGGYHPSIYGADRVRGQKMVDWLKAHGLDPNNTVHQGRYMAHEGWKDYPTLRAAIQSKDQDRASVVATVDYEGPGAKHNPSVQRERINNARMAGGIRVTETTPPPAANSNIPELRGGGARPGPTIERGALVDRQALTNSNGPRVEGGLTVDANVPPGTTVTASGGGVFKDPTTTRSTTMSRETARQLLTVRQ